MHDGPLLLLPATNSLPPKIEIGPQAELRGGEKKFYKIISLPENEAKQRKRLLYPLAADQKVARNGTGGYVVTAGQMSIFFFCLLVILPFRYRSWNGFGRKTRDSSGAHARKPQHAPGICRNDTWSDAVTRPGKNNFFFFRQWPLYKSRTR